MYIDHGYNNSNSFIVMCVGVCVCVCVHICVYVYVCIKWIYYLMLYLMFVLGAMERCTLSDLSRVLSMWTLFLQVRGASAHNNITNSMYRGIIHCWFPFYGFIYFSSAWWWYKCSFIYTSLINISQSPNDKCISIWLHLLWLLFFRFAIELISTRYSGPANWEEFIYKMWQLYT